jgi:hypothetical protein
MREIADDRQSDSVRLRAEGRQLRNETAIKTKWDTYRNDARLHDRYTENCVQPMAVYTHQFSVPTQEYSCTI